MVFYVLDSVLVFFSRKLFLSLVRGVFQDAYVGINALKCVSSLSSNLRVNFLCFM